MFRSYLDYPAEVLANILSQLLPEDLMLLTHRQRREQADRQVAADDTINITAIKKLRLAGEKALIAKLESDPKLMQRLWKKKYQQHFPHSYQHINKIINADENDYSKSEFDWQGMFCSQYDRFVDRGVYYSISRDKILLCQRFLSAVKESNLDEVTFYFSKIVGVESNILDDFQGGLEFSPIDWAIMKWCDAPEGNTQAKQAARAVLDHLYKKISTGQKLYGPLAYRPISEWAILCCQSEAIIGRLPQAQQPNKLAADVEKYGSVGPHPALLSSLQCAIRAHNLPLIRILLENYLIDLVNVYGVDPRLLSLPLPAGGWEARLVEELRTLFFIAAKRGYRDVLELICQVLFNNLEKSKADAFIGRILRNPSHGQMQVLSYATQYGHLECARFLLELGASVDLPSTSSYYARDAYPIHDAICNGDGDMISLLLSYNAKLDVVTNKMRYPIMELCYQTQVINPHRHRDSYGYRLLPDDEEELYYLPSLLIREHRLLLINYLVENKALVGISVCDYGVRLVLLEASLAAKLNASRLDMANAELLGPHLNNLLLSEQIAMIRLLFSLDLEAISLDEFGEKLLPYKDILMADNEIAKEIRAGLDSFSKNRERKDKGRLINSFEPKPITDSKLDKESGIDSNVEPEKMPVAESSFSQTAPVMFRQPVVFDMAAAAHRAENFVSEKKEKQSYHWFGCSIL